MKNSSLYHLPLPLKKAFAEKLELGLAEDLGDDGVDITTAAIFSDKKGKNPLIEAEILAKEDLIVCGLPVLGLAFGTTKKIELLSKEGDFVQKGTIIASVITEINELLTKERVVLNILQRLCGIASKTFQMRKMLSEKVGLFDTRKNLPGYRLLEKYAVTVGGGENHRMGLYDQYMIKDNHISIYQSQNKENLWQIVCLIDTDRNITYAKEKKWKKIIVECENISQVEEILIAKQKGYLQKDDVVMLDNMQEENLKKSIKIIGGNLKIEISGSMNENSIRMINNLMHDGYTIDRISSGALSHQATAKDISIKKVWHC